MTMRVANHDPTFAAAAEPTWEIARLFPTQGDWTVEDYLALDTNQLIEFTNGHLEFLSMPTPRHQRIVVFLYRIVWAFITERQLGEVLVAPLRVRVSLEKFREPDLVFVLAEHLTWQGEHFWAGVDLVVEVISPDDPDRDYVKKRKDYASAGIAEYWIVDPLKQAITVLTLKGETYTEHGVFIPGTAATSALLAGFAVDVTEVFAAAK